MKWLVLFFSWSALAQICPSGDEPALVQSRVVVCGYEDHDFPIEGAKRAFSDFTILNVKGDKVGAKVFSSLEGVTYLIGTTSKGLNLEELWEVGEKSEPALQREIVCETECKVSAPKCILKAPKNPFPKSLAELEAKIKKGKAAVADSEDLVDDVFAQAVGGEKAAIQFFSGVRPKVLEGASAEAWDSAHARLGACKQ